MAAEQIDQAFVLHLRPYRETSVLVDCVTAGTGRQTLLYKGVRGSSRSAGHRYRLLQPFQQLQVSWSGRHELKIGRMLEASGAALLLQGVSLYSGMYINELLVRLLGKDEPCPRLFIHYLQALHELAGPAPIEPVLRRFELALLAELGYGIALDCETLSGALLVADAWYQFHPEHGFSRLDLPTGGGNTFVGGDLLAIAKDEWSGPQTRQAAKRLMRLALAPLLGDRPLQSRQLFSRLPIGSDEPIRGVT